MKEAHQGQKGIRLGNIHLKKFEESPSKIIFSRVSPELRVVPASKVHRVSEVSPGYPGIQDPRVRQEMSATPGFPVYPGRKESGEEGVEEGREVLEF